MKWYYTVGNKSEIHVSNLFLFVDIQVGNSDSLTVKYYRFVNGGRRNPFSSLLTINDLY